MHKFKRLVLAAVMLSFGAANAAILSDYNKSTAASDGWTIVYQGAYGGSFDYASVLNSIAAGSQVALASSSSSGALTFDLFAGTSLSILQTFTGYNSTIYADDAYWYRNNNSVGFSPEAAISQSSADTGGVWDSLGGADLRLSWHSGDGNTVYGGWRSGTNIWLNSDYTWQRYVLVREDQQVPEPASIVLLGLGLAGLAASRRKKS